MISQPVDAQQSTEQTVVLENYQLCLEKVSARAAKKSNPSLREKLLAGGIKGCERSIEAELGILAAQREQAEIQARIAEITDSFIRDAKEDLGI